MLPEPVPVPAASGLTAVSAAGLARLLATHEVTVTEIVAAHLQRIAAVDPQVHALVHVDADAALARAARLDAARRAGDPGGPLAGVPFVVKDNMDVRGQCSASGSRAHDGVVAMRDAAAVHRVLAAGGVLLGRANMDELAMGASTQTSAHGATRNPRDLRRSPGGSSGGCAAALDAGLAVLALGTDTGGSIREPASQCGVVGMAPTPGLVPLQGTVPFAGGFDRVGPMARTVGDTAALLGVLRGRPDLGALHPSGLRRLRVGVVQELCGARNQPGVLERFAAAALALDELGVQVVPVSVPDAPAALGAYMTLTSAACVAPLERYVRTGQAGPEVVRRWQLGTALLAHGERELAAAEAVRNRLHAQVRAALAGCEVLLSPTMPTTAPLLFAAGGTGELTDPMSEPYTDCWTVVANLTGLPALSLPVGSSPQDHMPIGIMLAAAPGGDADVLALAAALEAMDLDDPRTLR